MIVGLASYPFPPPSKTIDPILPVCSSNVTVAVASAVGASPVCVIFTVGKLLYPKPLVANVSVSSSNPKIAVPAAFAPVVSVPSGVNETVGALPDV